MKKILLASTILAASAGFAAAEVAVSGSARMGVIYDGSDSLFSSRVRISFTGSGTTDGGLTFGASMRADQDGGNADGAANGSSTVYLSGAFGKLTMGDTGNAPDSLVGQVSGIGYGPGALDGAADVGFYGKNTATGVSYAYTAGALSFEVGAAQVGSSQTDDDGITSTDYVSAAVAYNAGAYTVAIGIESGNDDDGEDSSSVQVVSAKATATFGAATVKAKIADDSRKGDMGYALSVDYAMGAATVTAFYADDNAADANMGVGVAYNLGGGASVKVGVGSVGGETVADAGITMSF